LLFHTRRYRQGVLQKPQGVLDGIFSAARTIPVTDFRGDISPDDDRRIPTASISQNRKMAFCDCISGKSQYPGLKRLVTLSPCSS